MNPDLNMLPGYPGLKSWPPFAGTQQFNSSTENQKNDMAHTAKPDARFKRFNPKRLPLFMACLLLFALTGMTDVLHAQSGSGSAAAGRQFYVSFLHSKYTTGPDLPSLGLKVAVMRTCRITARNNFTNSYLKDGSGNDWDGLYTVAPGIYTFDLPYNDMVNTASGKTSKTITVSSTEDINVYAINYQNGSTDAATVLPVSVWGTEYYLATGIPYPHSPADYPSACSVTAREDGTQIFLPGTSTPITLNENEVYHYYVSDNLTGKKVTATKPVAVFSGNVVASSAGDAKYGWTGTIGLGGSAEHCYEQLWSTDKWGTDFFVWPVKTTSVAGSDWGGIMCIVAHGNGTKVTVSGGIDGGPHEYNLNDGGMAYVSYKMSGLTRVVSDKSIMVFTLLPDAAVTYIPPTNQRITHATLSPFVLTPSNITAHAVELLVPAAYWDAGLVEIREDGAAVPGSACTVTSGGSFSDWYTVRRETGNTDVTVDVSCPGSGFLAYMYGYGGAETYGYLAGAGAYNLQCYFTVKEKETNNDIYYENTSELTHTFQTGDEIVVKRTVEQTFTDIAWRINGLLYSSIAEDPSATMKTLSFPATAFRGGQNTLTMSVRFKDATADSVYTCNIWRKVVLQMNDDTRTVQKYRWTEIDVLANDVLPDGLFSPGPFSLLDSVVLPPTGGTLCASGSGRNSKLIYLNNGTNNLPGHIDSLVYRFRVNESGMLHEFRATAYIYILDEIHGASACGDRDFTATLREAPAGTGFEWYAVADPATLLHTGASHTFDMPAGEDSMLVKPGVPDAAAPWNRAGGFPPGLLAVHAAGADPRPMRWTGLVNTDWYNPANWVEQDAEGWEAPVLWPPAACTDVDIFSDVPHFPELIDSAWCRRITLHDRALFKNPHVLNYDSARVELKLKATERDRFVMWSAPLRDMYSGDYHFDGADGKPNWGDVSMNYFQRANPDNVGSVAQKNTFTATFGSPGDSLKPGLAFNLRVTSTDISRESSWTFPQPETSYTAANKTYPTPRTFPHRFITDGLEQNASGQYLLPVLNDVAYNNLVQIVNPYLAWLCIDSFLQNNKLLTSGYLIWDGRTNSGFKAVKLADNPDGMRYTYTGGTGDFIVSPKYIAPLQSFFVAKNSLVAGMGLLLSSVSMSPAWTVTNVPGSESGSYVLFASEAESGVLHVRALQGDRTAYAALQFDSRTATPEYRDHEDVRALFSDLSPLAVYVLTALREPLAISADGDYQTHTTALGLRLPESGEVRLEFTGMEGFGHDVFLVDRELDTEISLQQTDSYTFTAVKPAGASTLELNDRFALRMEYTGVGNRPAEELRPEVTVGASAGYIHVRSLTGRIDRIDVYNMPGTLVASAAPAGVNELNIPVAGAQTYLVKVETSGQTVVKKIFVK